MAAKWWEGPALAGFWEGCPGGQHQALPTCESLPYLSWAFFWFPSKHPVSEQLLCVTPCCPAFGARASWRGGRVGKDVGPDPPPTCPSSVAQLCQGTWEELSSSAPG